MNVERVLERIGPKKEEIVIDKNFFYCGRMKESDLVCLSLLVSREHCVFTKLTDGLYVTDLGSSNGVYINGVRIRQKKQMLLNENDYIGIGCADISNLDSTMFVYRFKNRVIGSNDCISNAVNNELDCTRLARKEQSRFRKSDSINIPIKIPKTEENRDVCIDNNIDNDDDDIIEIIDCNNPSNSTYHNVIASNVKKEKIECIDICDSAKPETVNTNLNRETFNGLSNSNLTKQNIEKFNIKNDIVQISSASSASNLTKHNIEKSNIRRETQVIPDIIDITDAQLPDKSHSTSERMQIDSLVNTDNIKNKSMHHEPIDGIPIQNNTSPININIKSEPSNNDESDSGITIKQEPIENCSFSQIDLVEINDDDDNIFPISQLFDKTDIKQECEDNDNGNSPALLFLDDDDENVITIVDSDDENVCQINKIIDLESKIKIESDLELANETKSLQVPVIDQPDHMCLTNDNENLDLPSSESTTNNNIDKTVEPLEEQPISLPKEIPLSEPSTSNYTSLANLKRTKGLEIVEPHFIKPKKRSEKTEKKDKKRSNDEEKSKKKSSDKKKRTSDSSHSSREHRTHKETSSKSKSHKKDKTDRTLSSSSKSKSSTDKNHKDSSLEKSTNRKNNDESENTRNDTSSKNGESSSIQNSSINLSRPRCKTTIVKVKVSTKTRGDMLCDSMQTLRPKPKKAVNDKKSDSVNDKKSDSAKSDSLKSASKPNNISSFVIPHRQIPSSSINSISLTSQLNSPPTSLAHNKNTTSTVLTNTTNHINLTVASSNSSERSLATLSADSVTNDRNASSLLKSSLSMSSSINSTQKRVTFKENIVSMKEFPIEEGNQLRNIKDGLSIRSTKKDFAIYKAMDLTIEDFLARVFSWEPVWLEQQQKVKALPPIVKQEDMQKLPNTFHSYEQYYRRMEVLLLLETWQLLLKEYECAGNRYKSSVVLPCSIARHSIRQMQTPNGCRYSMMQINTLVSKNQLRLQNHPVYGDMIILEYTIKQGDIQKIRRAFAYVIEVKRQNSYKYLQFNDQLRKHVANPDALLQYIVQTRIIDEHTVQFDQVSRLRSILYMRSHLRLIQGLQYVPRSALRESILNVDIDDFQLDSVSEQQIHQYDLVTNEKLNDRQMEAVIKFTNASVKLVPKIGLLIGPPGTGKSKVIANLVTQILYGEGRYLGGRPLRILVCAPSNAAIDEIVLRLLEIRSAIKEYKFKMVRTGRIESMHEEVKKISVTELAKRDALKTYSNQQQKYSESIEQKRCKLKNDIDALELLVANNPHNARYRDDLNIHKEKYKKLTHKSPEEEAAELNRLENSSKLVILQKANVIACTLSSCYTGQMESVFGGNTDKIATCIVDEATQSCEAEILIPLILGVKSLILVGDPNQLPATVMSTEAKKLGLDKSLFTRAKEALETQIKENPGRKEDPVITLNIQYRMVNAISHWPNRYFYGGKLIDRVNYKQAFPFQPYRILSLDGLQDDIKFSNTSEALFVGNLINCLMTCAKLTSWNKIITVGVITPYQNQKSLILSTIIEQTKNVPDNLKKKFITEVNTIDSFQGQERDVIIMSCVRSSGIGFMSDQQRLCVALTRAKFTLIICGNFTTFRRDNTWNDLLKDARSRGVVARLNTTAKPNEIKPHVIRLD